LQQDLQKAQEGEQADMMRAENEARESEAEFALQVRDQDFNHALKMR
jgi:hypothetical protein